MSDGNGKPDDDGRPPAHRRGEGDYYLTPGEENRIIAKLLAAKRWKATDQHKEAALGVVVRNMGNKDGRVSNAAVSNLIKMESQNQADEHKLMPDLHDHQHGGRIDVAEAQQELLNDPNYLEYQRTLAIDCDSSDVCEGGEQGEMEDGQAPGGGRPGANGHRNGQE